MNPTSDEIHSSYGLDVNEYVSAFWESFKGLSIQALPDGKRALYVRPTGQEELPSTYWNPIGQTKLITTGAGMSLNTEPGKRDYALLYGPLRAAAPGTYSFKLAYRLEAGNILLGILSGDQSRWLENESYVEGGDGEYSQLCSVHLEAGDSFCIMISKNNNQSESSRAVIFSLQGVQIPPKVAGGGKSMPAQTRVPGAK
jgi:hypothetical protein